MDRKKPIGFVTHKELQRNHDLPLYQDHCEQGRIVNPTDLRLVPSRTRPSGVALSDGTGILDQLMLELHQDELEALDEDLLIELGKVCWNDYRTIYFVHDKRMLGLLRRELKWLVASGDITAAQADILRNGLAETYLCGDPVFRSALFSTKPAEKNNWVLKKCMSGKGDGMVFGKDIDEETWKDMLSAEFLMSCADRSFSGSNRGSSSSRSSSRSSSTGRTTDSSAGGSSGNVSGISSPDEDAPNAKPMISDSLGQNNHGHYVLQRYVKQKKLDMIVQDKDCENLTMLRVKWYVVGTMTCVNRTLLAPAYYRTNNTDIVAVGRGGLMIIAASDPDLTFTYTLPGPEEKVESELQPAMDAELKPEPGPNSKPEQGESKPGPAGQLAAVEHQEASTANLLTVPSDARVVAGALEATETEIEFVKNSLMKYGLAVVDMELDDPASEYMVDIIKSLGEPLEHSSRHGILWDVKPIEGMDSKRGARSETMESFPWHTVSRPFPFDTINVSEDSNICS